MSATALRRVAPTEPAAGLGLMRQPAPWLAALAFVFYLVPAVSVLQLDPDAVQHIDLARRFVAGQGYVLGIKSFHLGDTQVLHNGLAERAPLYPLLVAAILRAGLGPIALQVVNALLAAACAALVCGIGTSLFGRRTGALGGLLAAASPPVLIFMVPPMTEALAISLVLLATWLVARDLETPRAAAFAAAGAALGLGYLTRPVTLSLAGALLVGVVFASRRRRALLRPLGGLLLGMAIFVVPVTLFSLLTRGSVSYSSQTYLYAVFQPSDVQRNAFVRPVTSPVQFVLANREFVLAAILGNVRRYAELLFLDPKWLLPLLPAWPLALLALVRGRYPRAAWPVLILAAANFSVYALTWAAWTRRYQLLTLLLLLPFAVDGLGRLGLARLRLPAWPKLTALHVAVVAVTLIWFPAFVQEYRGTFRYGDAPVETRSYHGVKWTGAISWVTDKDLTQMLDWVSANTQPNDVLAHAQPDIFTFFTGRLSTRLPRALDAEGLETFVVNYRVSYVLLNNYDGYRRRYQDDLEALAGRGIRVTAIGDYRVFDTRGLWR